MAREQGSGSGRSGAVGGGEGKRMRGKGVGIPLIPVFNPFVFHCLAAVIRYSGQVEKPCRSCSFFVGCPVPSLLLFLPPVLVGLFAKVDILFVSLA